MLERRTGKTKDDNGLEFSYEFYGEYEYILKEKVERLYSKKCYVAKDWPDLKATTLKDLKKLVSDI